MVGVRKLGRTVALHFAQKGWRVLCASRTAADVEALARDVSAAGGQGVPAVCDLQAPETLTRFAEDSPDLVVAAQTMGGTVRRRFPWWRFRRRSSRSRSPRIRRARGTCSGRSGRRCSPAAAAPSSRSGPPPACARRRDSPRSARPQHALRALVQVAAREWRARGVHVAYLPVDGPIGSEPTRASRRAAIAEACAYLHAQQPDAWTHELLLRPSGGDWSAPT